MRKAVGGTAVLVTVLVGVVAVAVAATTQNYAPSRNGSYETVPLLSVGDVVKETSNPGLKYQMVGIPDGLGIEQVGSQTHVYMNHEFGRTVESQPLIDGPRYRGAFVSRWVVNGGGNVVSGERAYDDVVYPGVTGYPKPAAQIGNTTAAFGRFCSAALGTTADGFTRTIYFTGEESGRNPSTALTPSNAQNYTGADGDPTTPEGGSAVAIFDNTAHVLPDVGRASWENIVPQRRPGDTKTVLMGLEDGAWGPVGGLTGGDQFSYGDWSYLYMYVGDRKSTGNELERNGLVGGKLYVLAKTGTAGADEQDLEVGTPVAVEWVEITGASGKTDAQLNAAAATTGALRFARVEDGAFDKNVASRFYFVTTGENPSSDVDGVENLYGHVYQLELSSADPASAGTLRLAVDADEVVKGGGDTALSPDNIDTSAGWLMIQEDGTSPSRIAMQAKDRDGGIWAFPLGPNGLFTSTPVSGKTLTSSPDRVVEMRSPGRDGTTVVNSSGRTKGVWETSGIVDASGSFGPDTFVFDVQAHRPTKTPDEVAGASFNRQVEDGQLLLLRPAK